MIDVSVKLYCKVKPKSSVCFHRHLYERCTKDTVSPQTEVYSSCWNKTEGSDEGKVNGLNKLREEV